MQPGTKCVYDMIRKIARNLDAIRVASRCGAAHVSFSFFLKKKARNSSSAARKYNKTIIVLAFIYVFFSRQFYKMINFINMNYISF